MMKNKPDTKLELETFFDAARQQQPGPGVAFLETVAQDALDLSQERAKSAMIARNTPAWATKFLRGIGGWQSLTALSASVFFGIAAGYMAPESLDYFNGTPATAATFNDDGFSVATDIETLFQEG
jgi:hypothetical protein